VSAPREEFVPTGLTLERAIKRFLQAQDLESTVRLIENSIEQIDNQIAEAKSRRKELSSQKNECLRQLRATARDEGDLPLLDLMEKFGPDDVPILTLMQDLHGGQAAS
jgi:hypothetical protein